VIGVYEYTPVNNYVNAEIPPHLEFPMLTQAQAAAGASHELDLLRNNPHGSNQTTNMMWGQLNGNSKKATLDKREKNRENDRVRRRRIKEVIIIARSHIHKLSLSVFISLIHAHIYIHIYMYICMR